MRFLLLIVLMLALALPLVAQEGTPDPIDPLNPTPTPIPLRLEGEEYRDRTLALIPIYLSGVGATPLQRNVNIRSGPGLEYEKVGVLRFESSADVIGYNGYDLETRECVGVPFDSTLDMWVKVQLGELRGWVARCTVVITGDMTRLLVHEQ